MIQDLFTQFWLSNTPIINEYLYPKTFKPQPELPLELGPNDSIQEINKWILARKKNYPSSKNLQQKQNNENEKQNMSQLEQKLRKRMRFIKSDCGENKALRLKTKNIKTLIQDLTSGEQKITTHNKQNNNYKLPKGEEISDDEAPIPQKIQKTEQKNIEEENQDYIKKRLSVAKDWMEKHREKIQEVIQTQAKDNTKQQFKVNHIVENLAKRQKEEETQLEDLLGDSKKYKFTTNTYKYRNNTLMASLLVDQIYKQNIIILQALKFIQDNKFFQE